MPRYEYLWEDGIKYKRPTKLPAPEYVDALMNWAQIQLDDEKIFPNQIGMYPCPGHTTDLTEVDFCPAPSPYTVRGKNRYSVSEKLSGHCSDPSPPAVPRLCPHLQQSF